MSLLRDLLLLIGAGLIVFGLHEWYAPLAYVTAGVMLAGVAFVWSWSARKEPR